MKYKISTLPALLVTWPEGKMSFDSHKCVDNIKVDYKEIEYEGTGKIYLAQHGAKW